MNNETQFEIELPDGKKVLIGLCSAVLDSALAEGDFVKLRSCDGFPPRLICIWLSIGTPVIIMLEAGVDSVYRPVIDINLMMDDVISIEKKMKDGSPRRTDIKICF